MSQAIEPQVIEPLDFSGLDEYDFSGNSVTVENKRSFLACYRVKGSVYHAAQLAGISRKTVYHYLQHDEVFVQAFEDFREDTADIIETSVFERAMKSDLLAMFYLKAHRSKFRDRVTLDIAQVESELSSRLTRRIDKTSQISKPTRPALPPAKKSDDNAD